MITAAWRGKEEKTIMATETKPKETAVSATTQERQEKSERIIRQIVCEEMHRTGEDKQEK